MKEKFYITTAIAYSSQKPHIGNTFEVIMTDAIARYKRSRGYDVFFLTGTDEHGQKIENYARDAGVTPKEYVDRISGEIRRIWDLVGAEYDKFIRTTDPYHEKTVAAIFRRLYEQGDIYKDQYEGWYCEPDEAFYTDTQVEEKDGVKICPDCGRPVARMREEAYKFRMSAYADRLIEYIESHPDFIEPEARKKEMINNFLKPGLQDLCVSRSSFKWGIPISFDNRHVVYVWLDALSNYITALGYNPDGDNSELFNKYWPADVHIIGKDILRFHTIYWPIFLMALGLPLPKKVFGHPWLNVGADKMSKSRGNAIYADDLIDVFGVDATRYYVLAEMPYVQDGVITYENMIARYNGDLANNLGNLVSRTHAMTRKYFGGIIPTPGTPEGPDAELRLTAETAVTASREKMDGYHIAEALDEIFTLFRRANKYIDETAPWVLAKSEEGKARLATVIYNLLESIRVGALLIAPFMPKTSVNILAQLGCGDGEPTFGSLVPGAALGEPEMLFARLDEEKTLERLRAHSTPKTAPAAEQTAEPVVRKPEIDISGFASVELRAAKVTEAKAVPKSKKLLCLQLDIGFEHRQVVSGIAEVYKPEDLVGKTVILVANLKPAVLCGVESNGMILAADSPLSVVFLPDGTVPGALIR